MAKFILNFLFNQRFLALYHDFHWF